MPEQCQYLEEKDGRRQHTVVGVLAVASISRRGIGLRLGLWVGCGGGSDRSRKGEKSVCVLHFEERESIIETMV